MKVPKTRKQFQKVLTENVMDVEFTKVDGSTRRMICTLRPDTVPVKETQEGEEKAPRKINKDVLPVWDIEVGAWRSFRVDSVTSFDIFQ